ncbi:PorT family protein [Hyunsoonleella flava]|uniref:PorT family protein n=1 Tax=Hyunsoonleella flava TaxID=2527939 RepID=A0A4Q9FLI2_9FLAO|nr:outer membrane beta-barrel protein [Hyunsoonleella flava]TBN06490.1 PorT family protein [Hyunsoonleella flava]
MKKSIFLLAILSIALSFTSCRIHIDAGYSNAADRFSVESGNTVPNSSATSQKSNYESKASVNSSSLLSNTSTTTKSGFYVGVAAADIELSDSFKFQPEARFIIVEDLNQINIPLLVKYNVVDKINAYAGPSLGYLLDAPTGLKSTNFGINIGGSYDLTDKFFLNARYDFGLSDLSENSASTVKLSNLLIGVGYKL